MNVIDIASYQASLDLNNINYDGVAIKATESNNYVNPYCDTHYQQAKAAGKKRAVYHFFDFGVDAVEQANFFVDNCAGYIRDAIFVLDWEGGGVADVAAALRFLQQVEARIGYKPAIYMSEWVENAYDWSSVVAGDYGLWAAKYSDYEIDNNYDMSNAGQSPNVTHWPFYFMWQWTSVGRISGYAGNLDCDIFYGDAATWDAYAGVQAAPAPTPVVESTPAPVVPPVIQEPIPVPVTPAPETPAPVIEQPPVEVPVVIPPVATPDVEPTTEPIVVPTPVVPVVPQKTVFEKVQTGVTLLKLIVLVAEKTNSGIVSTVKKAFDKNTKIGRTIRTWIQAIIGVSGFVITLFTVPGFGDLMATNGLLAASTISTYVAVSTYAYNTFEQLLSWLNNQ